MKLYCEMIIKGFVPTVGTYNALINDYAKAGKMRHARELLNEMLTRGRIPNSSTYDILICGWCKLSCQPEMDRELRMSYRAEAKKLLIEMCEKGHVPSDSTISYISSNFSLPGKKSDAQKLLKLFTERKRVGFNVNP
ncbi:hypothetical protein HN51_037217 [Arachis hypogaea]